MASSGVSMAGHAHFPLGRCRHRRRRRRRRLFPTVTHARAHICRHEKCR